MLTDKSELSPAVQKILRPADRQDEMTAWLLKEDCYLGAKRLDDGSYAVFMRLAFTHAIALGCDRFSWLRRFCYSDLNLCLGAFEELKTKDDQPEGWIARRPEVGDPYAIR
jgi:hypothetical protein